MVPFQPSSRPRAHRVTPSKYYLAAATKDDPYDPKLQRSSPSRPHLFPSLCAGASLDPRSPNALAMPRPGHSVARNQAHFQGPKEEVATFKNLKGKARKGDAMQRLVRRPAAKYPIKPLEKMTGAGALRKDRGTLSTTSRPPCCCWHSKSCQCRPRLPSRERSSTPAAAPVSGCPAGRPGSATTVTMTT